MCDFGPSEVYALISSSPLIKHNSFLQGGLFTCNRIVIVCVMLRVIIA